MEMSEGMRAFAEKYNRSLSDPKLRDLYELDLSARRDQAAIAYTAELKGERKAYENVVRSMLQKGFNADLIYDCVDAPRSEIDAIIAKLRASGRA